MTKACIFILVFASLISLSFADQTKVITVQAGQNFTITLEANATTGYRWQLAKPLDESLIRLVSSEYLPDKTELVGAGGKQIWVFKALNAGKTAVSFKYVRPWEKNIQPEKEESFVVIIKG